MRFSIFCSSLVFFSFFVVGCVGNVEDEKLPTSVKDLRISQQPLFELLDPASTGVAFRNILKANNQVSFHNANYLFIGGGVGVGDFNKDGLEDLYLVAVTGENKLFLNKGNMQFEDVTQQAGVGLAEGVKTGVSIVDINADGWLDIYQCRTGQEANERGNKLFVNQQDGTFREESVKYGLNTNYASTEANFFDYDGDGDLDVYMINRPIDFSTNNKVFVENVNGVMQRVNKPTDDFESDRLFRNNGDLTFTDVSRQAGIYNRAFSLSVNILDVNEDQLPDIYVANDYIEPDHLYINQGDGTFKDEWTKYLRHLCYFSMGADIADLNNDGWMDIVTLDMLPDDNYTHKQNGTSAKWDRYKSLTSYGFGHQIMRNMLQLNNGNGGFREIACLAGIHATDWSWAPMIADFDNDGWKDIFITNGMKKDVNDLDFTNYGLDSLRAAGAPVSNFFSLLKYIPSHKPRNFMYQNSRDLTMKDVSEEWGLGQQTFSNGAMYVDLDNDGDLDLVVHNTDDNAFIYKNNARETGLGSYLQFRLEGPADNPSGAGTAIEVVTTDCRQVLEKHLNRGFLSAADQPLHFGLGDAAAADRVSITWPDGKVQTLRNLPVNQRVAVRYKDAAAQSEDTVVPSVPCREITGASGLLYEHEENRFEDFDQQRLLHRKYSANGPALAAGDINGDGMEDVFIGGSFKKPGAIFLQTQSGQFQKLSVPALNDRREDVDAIFFDANGDGALDLYIAGGGVAAPANQPFYTDRLLINKGNGELTLHTNGLPASNENTSCVNVFDFDRDGDLDIAVGGGARPGAFPLSAPSYLLKNERGTFKDATQEWAPEFAKMGIVNAIEFADLDGDSRPEMIVAGEWMGITVFEIDPNGFKNVTADYGLTNTEGWWHCLKIADFNGDGFKDIIAGNLGLNNRLKASPSAPFEMFALDIDQNNTIDPVFTYFNHGKRYPLAHRDVLISQVPGMKKKFPKYKAYSKATLDEVLTKEQQASAIHLKTSVFANSIFWGTKNRQFIREDLPTAAQVAPIMDIAVRDVNGDGTYDAIAIGNDYGLEIESGRMDAGDGLVLLGAKQGALSVAPNTTTGFWSSGQGRKIALLDLPAPRDFLIVVGNNNGRLEVHKWSGNQPLYY
ncbi:MAG: VCBS repeat-containing protein [Bacteroidota bacterium]